MDAVTGQCEMVLVPLTPTRAMIEAAWDATLAEDAEWVWEEMIKAYLSKIGNSDADKG